MARGARLAAMSPARAIAAASSDCAGTTWSTRPSFSASSAFTGLLFMIISSAFGRPTRRGSRCVPPKPGMTPSWSSGSPSCALGVHTRALHAMASSSPPPSARFSMAATVGFGPASTSALSTALKSATFGAGLPSVRSLSCVMSNPPLNLPLLPVTTMALTLGSACAASNAVFKPSRTARARRRGSGEDGGQRGGVSKRVRRVDKIRVSRRQIAVPRK